MRSQSSKGSKDGKWVWSPVEIQNIKKHHRIDIYFVAAEKAKMVKFTDDKAEKRAAKHAENVKSVNDSLMSGSK